MITWARNLARRLNAKQQQQQLCEYKTTEPAIVGDKLGSWHRMRANPEPALWNGPEIFHVIMSSMCVSQSGQPNQQQDSGWHTAHAHYPQCFCKHEDSGLARFT